jgi:hypothetical protein
VHILRDFAGVLCMEDLPPDEKRNSFALGRGAGAFIVLECLVGIQGLLAYQDRFLTVGEMQQRGITQGLPFIWHFGMWGDFLIISPLAGYLIGRYSDRWRLRWILVSLVIGFILATTFSWLYTLSDLPGAHVQNRHLTAAGVVHLFYMAIALAVFMQFFFFTEDISARVLRIVSVLLFAHVLVGTHMALGVFKVLHPVDWYPDQPLTSFFGWGTVGAVVLGLAWRNFGIQFFVDVTFDIFHFFTGVDPTTDEGYLKFLDVACGSVLAVSYYRKSLELEWQQGKNWMALTLLFIIAVKYALSRISVKQELAIGKTLYPPERVPNELQLHDHRAITIQVVAFMALYLLLGWVADYIIAVSAIMTVIACADFRTRYLIQRNIDPTLSDEKYAPIPTEKGYQAILDRRVIARWYLDELPHLRKEAGVIIGCAAAFGISVYGHLNSTDLNFAAYTVLITTQVINEIITLKWRFARFLRLRALRYPNRNPK